MTDDEKVVREFWDDPIFTLREAPRGYIRGTEFLLSEWCQSESEAWSRARAFTEQIRKQIAEVEEEIEAVENVISDTSDCSDREGAIVHLAMKRILAREHTALADLKRGMKG